MFAENRYKLLIISIFLLFFISITFFLPFFFLYMIMHTINIVGAIKKMSVNEIETLSWKNINKLDFLRKIVITHWKAWKKDLLLRANKLIEKIPDSCYAKEHYQSFLRKKSTKSVKHREIITYQARSFENPNIVYIKSFITEHPTTSHKLSRL